MTIVIVDDGFSMREMLRVVFEERGFEVFVGASAAACLYILDSRRVDAVLTDFDMPGGTGLALCRAIRERSAGSEHAIPVWIMTGCLTLTTDEALRAGAEQLFLRPFRPADIRRAIEERLAANPAVSVPRGGEPCRDADTRLARRAKPAHRTTGHDSDSRW